MSLFPRRRKIRVETLWLGYLYKASYMGYEAYGRTQDSAVTRVQAKYDNRFRPLRDIPNAVGNGIASLFYH